MHTNVESFNVIFILRMARYAYIRELYERLTLLLCIVIYQHSGVTVGIGEQYS